MKFSIATIAALAALAVAAPVDTAEQKKPDLVIDVTNAKVAPLMVFPKEMDQNTDGAIIRALEATAHDYIQNSWALGTEQWPATADFFKDGSDATKLADNLKNLVTYAQKSHAASWKNAINLNDKSSTLAALEYVLLRDNGVGIYTAEMIVNAAEQVYAMYQAQNLAAQVEDTPANHVKIVQNYEATPAPSDIDALSDYTWSTVPKKDAADYDKLSKQFDKYVQDETAAHEALLKEQASKDAAAAQAAKELADKAGAQTNQLAVANSNSNSNSSSNSNSNSNASANVGIFFIGANGQPIPAANFANGTLPGVNGTDSYITIYETDCPVTTTDAAGHTVVTHTKSTVTSTVCPKCTKTSSAAAEKTQAALGAHVTAPAQEGKDDIVTVYVTDCPVTTTDAAGNTVVSHSQSTVTSTVCTKCTNKPEETSFPKGSPRVAIPEGDKTVRLTQTLTHTLNGTHATAPPQAPKNVPAQANGASKAAAGVAAVALPMVMAALL
ncbi:hypothetical protein CJU90_4463 [Yarrowia sp. C11]|nr:hypothetical protein CKK34_6744 [Yarrowia sp. E02]KAG5365385.1 hypothetical protein CJU90_4463 [Yarrowia sp. C11]